jgi:hypothetical protein
MMTLPRRHVAHRAANHGCAGAGTAPEAEEIMPHDPPTYWQLVEQLMHLGWYREGQDRARDPGGRCWRFREGHTIDGRAASDLGIVAASEGEAMRTLVAELRQHEAVRRTRRSVTRPSAPA